MTRRILTATTVALAAVWVAHQYRQLLRELALAEQEAGYWWTAAEHHRTASRPETDGPKLRSVPTVHDQFIAHVNEALAILRQQNSRGVS